MQKESVTNSYLLNDVQIMNMSAGMTTKRDCMLIENSADAILEEIISLKAKTKTLPITMRKLYSYKVVEINRKQEEKKKVIPLVLRKRALYEKTVNCG